MVFPEESILKRGARAEYRGTDLRFIGMPVGGICAGEVLLGGDGQLWLWDVFNQIKVGVVAKTIDFKGQSIDAASGANYIDPPEQIHPFLQGVALEVDNTVRPMNRQGWKDISFIGEYPIGFVTYRDADSPIHVDLETFSPYIPLESENSGLPCVIQQYKLKNVSAAEVKVRMGGWLENAAGLFTLQTGHGIRVNTYTGEPGIARIDCSLKENSREATTQPDIIFEDFEKPTYEGWTVEGMAFDPGPIEIAKMPPYQADPGAHGKRLACSYNARNGESIGVGDGYKGRLTSREFNIERRYVGFMIGGGNHPGKTCLNLIIDGKVVHTATGKDREWMDPTAFDVQKFLGKTAHIEIVDDQDGGWGHVNVDDIVFSDQDPTWTPLAARTDYGTLSLSLLEPTESAFHQHGVAPESLFSTKRSAATHQEAEAPERLTSGLVDSFTLHPGEERTVTFLWCWNFPNMILNKLGHVGNHYATQFNSSGAVADYVGKNIKTLTAKTRLWHDTWYDSTLPYWLLDRTMGNNATLATATCLRFTNGRFYAWEGVGSCEGTCGHVWAYAQGPARLFPNLERSVRERIDYAAAFHKDTGIIEFRGEYGNGYATDSQGGYVLRTYREHQTSKDSSFLNRVYPRAKLALQYLIAQDGNEDGIIENAQHNTLDVDLYGASSWLSSIYLAALRAGEKMATEMNDPTFADQCRRIADAGMKNIADQLWNGDYFIQRLDLSTHLDALRYGNGCEIDQVMGQWWAFQLGLDRVLEPDKTKAALKALFKNNFIADVGPFREKEKAGRWYAAPGEAGLIMCSFPKGDKESIVGKVPTWASMYFNECMTGFEYQAAGHMVSEGLVREGLTVAKAVHDRYHPSKRNPWNEVECSDHYARCMAVHGVFLAACGFDFHGPKGELSFAPQISPEHFKAPFNVAEGWGTYEQKASSEAFEASLTMKYGDLELQKLQFKTSSNLSKCEVKLEGKLMQATLQGNGIRLAERQRIRTGQTLIIRLT